MIVASLDKRSVRYSAYAAVAAILFFLAIAARGYDAQRTDTRFNLIVADGKSYYVYLPSLIIDGDLDFTNQIMQTWGPELGWIDFNVRTPTGLMPNKYPIGLSFTLLPAFLMAHGFALAGHSVFGYSWLTPDGYSLPYQLTCLAMILTLSLFTMILIDRLLSGYFKVKGSVIACGVAAFWLGSHYAWYCFREPFMIHVISGFWVTAVVFISVKVHREATSRGRILATHVLLWSFAMSMAIICRPTNAFVAPVLVWALIGIARAGMLGRFVRILPAAVPGLLPLLVQSVIWHELNGSWLHYSYNDERFIWLQPALLQTLFSLHKGLFIWTPMLLVAAAGIAWYLFHRRDTQRGESRRSFVAALLMSGIILWYLNSAWWFWGFGWSFGARAFLELAGVFVIGLSLAFEQVRRNAAARTAVAAFIVLCVVCNYGLMALYQTGRINRGEGLGGWSVDAAPQWMLIAYDKELQAKRTSDAALESALVRRAGN